MEEKLEARVQISSLMTPLEMNTRLAAGLDPLDLSIEKWERIVALLADGHDEKLSFEMFSSASCALCADANALNDCRRCVLADFLGHPCDEDDEGMDHGPWSDFFWRNEDDDGANPYRLAAAKRMLEVLKQCREAQ